MQKETLQKIRRKLQTKKDDAKKRGIKISLTLDDYCELLSQAGITVDQVGNKLGCYVLGRYNDEGDYYVGNCRFITVSENYNEGMISKPAHSLSLGGGSYDSCKGTLHYKSKGLVNTPWGTFETIAKAANDPSCDCSKAAIHRRIKAKIIGYFYS